MQIIIIRNVVLVQASPRPKKTPHKARFLFKNKSLHQDSSSGTASLMSVCSSPV